MAQTELNDRSGKPIFTGDYVQYRLSLGAKRGGGPWILKVTQTKKGVKLVDPNGKISQVPLQNQTAQYVVIVDTSERER